MTPRHADEILAEIRRAADEGDPRSLPDLLCASCARALPGSGVSLALMSASGAATVIAATDGPAGSLQESQFSLGEGPCFDVFTTGRPVLGPGASGDLAERWPAFGPVAWNAGVGAIFAFPLQIGAIRLGVLELYRSRPTALGEGELAVALAYADAVTLLVLELQGEAAPGELHPQFSDLWLVRAAVHQATGMVSVQAEVGLVDALLLMRARAYSTGRALADVAGDVVARQLRFGREDDNGQADPADGPAA